MFEEKPRTSLAHLVPYSSFQNRERSDAHDQECLAPHRSRPKPTDSAAMRPAKSRRSKNVGGTPPRVQIWTQKAPRPAARPSPTEATERTKRTEPPQMAMKKPPHPDRNDTPREEAVPG